MGDNGIVLIRKSAITLAAVMAAALAAHGGEPEGFHPGLYAGEVAGGLLAGTPSIIAGLRTVITAPAPG